MLKSYMNHMLAMVGTDPQMGQAFFDVMHLLKVADHAVLPARRRQSGTQYADRPRAAQAAARAARTRRGKSLKNQFTTLNRIESEGAKITSLLWILLIC